MTYEKVSGALPPGVHLDKNTGAITGRIPDVDATYEFGIRVTDSHGKYADQIFSIDTRGKYYKISTLNKTKNCTDVLFKDIKNLQNVSISLICSLTEKDQCLSTPCLHGGTCNDDIDDFICTCAKPYGGKTCQMSKSISKSFTINEKLHVDL